MSMFIASSVLLFWVACLATAAYSAMTLSQQKNKSAEAINGYIIALATSSVIGALLSFKLVSALKTVLDLSDTTATRLGAAFLLMVIVGAAVATIKLFKIMKDYGGHGDYTKGYY